MNTKQAIAKRIKQLCKEKGTNVNDLSNSAGMSPSTVYSMLNNKSKNPGVVTIKKLCDGFETPITLADFFDSDLFRNLPQEIN